MIYILLLMQNVIFFFSKRHLKLENNARRNTCNGSHQSQNPGLRHIGDRPMHAELRNQRKVYDNMREKLPAAAYLCPARQVDRVFFAYNANSQ